MTLYSNKFFSSAGQKERLSNVGATLKAAVTGKGVQSHTGVKPVDAVLSAAASRPFTTAALGAGGFSVATIGGKATLSAVATKKVAGTLLVTPIVGSVVGKVGVKKSASAVLDAQKDVSNFAGNIAGFIKDPSIDSGKNIFKENPFLAGAATLAGVAAAGKGIAGVAHAYALKENTQALTQSAGAGLSQMVPLTPQTQVLGQAAGGTTTKKRSSKSQKKSSAAAINPIRITIHNQTRSAKNNFIKQLTYKR